MPALLLALALPAAAQLRSGIQRLPPPAVAAAQAAGAESNDLPREKFFVFLPRGFHVEQPYGVLVYVHSGDAFDAMPSGWEPVLQQRRLVFIAPQDAGNKQPVPRRVALAAASARALAALAHIETGRVYVAGLSGGGRVASFAAFSHPDLFSGGLGICGMDFCRAVPRAKATRTDDYGVFELPPAQAEAARAHVRFAIVTGPKDFRYGNLLDIFEGGYRPDGYTARLFDVPGMGHALCTGKALDEALAFLEQREPAPARQGAGGAQ